MASAPATPVAPSPDFDHPALLYADDDGYVRATLAFVRGGLRRGEPVLVAVPGPRIELLRGELGGVARRVRFVDMAEAGRNPNRIIPWVLRAFADEHAGRRVRVIGEPIWPGRTTAEVSQAVQHEALVNRAFAGSSATLLCPYDAARLDPAILGYAARTHPVLDRNGARQRSTAYTEPDVIVAALNQPLPDPRGPVSELVFDVANLRAVRLLVRTHAQRAGLPDDRVADLQVAVNEIATNTLVHGNGPGTVRTWAEPDRLICEVRGPGEITDSLAGRAQPGGTAVRGWGLLLANRMCDVVQTYTNGTGTTTRLHMRR